MKKIVLFLLFALVSRATAQTPEEKFRKATELYNQAQYEQAVRLYKEILQAGKTSAALYFNLANAYYKQGQVAPAIYYYEKAQKLDSADPEIQDNKRFAQQMLIDKITPLPQTWFERLTHKVVGLASASGWGVCAILWGVGFVLSFLAYYFVEKILLKRLFFTLMLGMLLFSGGSYLLGRQSQGLQTQPYGILFDKSARVFSEPNTYSKEAFSLHEGTKVEILERLAEWYKIRIADGKTGWIRQESLKEI